ncbi:MAG: hypothetical protein ACRD0K_04840 [Egibacteraceae bacterium]
MTPLAISGPPAAYVQFDLESTPEELFDVVAAELVATASSRRTGVGLAALASAVIAEYPYYHGGAQRRLRKTVLDQAIERRIALAEPALIAPDNQQVLVDEGPTSGDEDGSQGA